MKKLTIILLIFLISLISNGVVKADDSNIKELQQKLDLLMKQIQEMDSAMKAQKSQIEALQNKIKELQSKETAQQVTQPTTTEANVTSKYKINIYGQIKLDTIYDTNDMGRDEFITYIPSTANGEDKTTFNIRDTRLGIMIEGPSLNGWTPRGRFETDFYGNDQTNARNGALRVRLAYIDFAKGNTLIRIGQDWNKIASLNPINTDFAIMGYNGNLWERVPQLTIEQKFDNGIEALLTIYRHRWSDDDDTFGSTKLDTQLHTPWIGARIGYSGKLIDQSKKAWLAIGGAVRKGDVNDNDVVPYVGALEFNIPYSIFELRGEGYIGQGIGIEYFHSKGSFNTEGHAILTRGGFIQLSAKPIKDILLTAGYGLDDPKNADVGNSFYQSSKYLMGNIYWTVMKDITAAFQAAHLTTDWESSKKHGTRYTTTLTYTW